MGAGQLDEDLDAALDAAADDGERLALLGAHVDRLAAHLVYARELRDAVAARLRARGVPTRVIARAARVGDSYLARRAFALGLPPRRHDRRH